MSVINLQDSFLNTVRKDKIRITIFLVNSFKLSGYVKGFDNYVIILESDKGQQLIYKHSISSILPSRNVKFFNAEEA